MTEWSEEIPRSSSGLRLCKVARGALFISDDVVFAGGRPAVLRTLTLAAISGHVGGPIGPETNFWADVLAANGDHLSEIKLNRLSWNALKNKWMRCRLLPP